jgi:hypothetical protein
MIKLTIPNECGFCKKCFRLRRSSSAFCGECQGEPERIEVFLEEQSKFPLLKEVRKIFPINDTIIFTYGDTVYGRNLGYGLICHELTHVTQQLKMGVEVWWKKYLKDVKFRVSQEVAAYRNQYQAYQRNDLLKAERFLDLMAGMLSGPLYGKVLTFDQAKKLISQK